MNPVIEEAVILVGGKGTRLSAVVQDRPKPLAIVAGHPFLDYLLAQLKPQGIRRVILCSGYMGQHMNQYAEERRTHDFQIILSQENSPMGTGGALTQALPFLQSDTPLVMNGDSYCEFSLESLSQIHCQIRGPASLWLAHVSDASRYGTVDVSCSGKITAFVEKGPGTTPGWVNAGIYLIQRSALAELPANSPLSFEREVLPAWISLGVGAIQGRGELVDIGTPESYQYSQSFFEKLGKKLF